MTASLAMKTLGDRLERRVALYYEALGYQVVRDLLLCGHQVDLVATRHIGGFGHLRIAIECKSRSHKVGINDVTPFLTVAHHLIREGEVTNAVIVSDSDFTSKARLAAPSSSLVKLLRIDDLESQLFNNAESLLRVVRDYEGKGIYKDYYPLEVVVEGRPHADAAAYVRRWAARSSGLLMLIGDFGSGKSTVLERAFYDAAKLRIESREEKFPIFLRLRGLRKYTDLWQFIEASLRDNQYIIPPRTVFESELQAGNVLVLLDGFDEIYSGANAQDRGNYLHFLRPLLKSRSPVVISSRPTFFNSFDDLLAATRKLLGKSPSLERMPKFGFDKAKLAKTFGAQVAQSLRQTDFTQVAELQQLSREKIFSAILRKRDIIRQCLNLSPEEFEARLYEIYDLEDLMRRPLLLDMILSTIATGGIDIKSAKSVGASTLYDYYTQQAAFRDLERSISDQFLSPEQRLEACRALARRMFYKGEILLSSAEVAKAVEESLRATSSGRRYLKVISGIERAVTDIRTCSFLRFAEDGSLSFTHKSFYEFFIAQGLYLASLRGPKAFFGFPRHRLNREIIYFLASYARDLEDFGRFLKIRMKDKLSPEDKGFLYSIAFASGEMLENCTLSVGTISGVEMVKAKIARADATMVRIDSSTVRRVECESWTLRDVSMDGCELAQVTFARSRLEIALHGSSFEDCAFTACKLSVGGKGGSFQDTEFNECSVVVDTELMMAGCRFEDCEHIDLESHALLLPERVKFRECGLWSSTPTKFYASPDNLQFFNCRLFGLFFNGSDLFSDNQMRSQRRVEISACSGVIFINYNEQMVQNGLLNVLGKANPHLFIIDARLVERIKTFVSAYQAAVKRQQAVQESDGEGGSRPGPEPRGKRKPLTTDVLSGPPSDLASLYQGMKAHFAKFPSDATTLPLLLHDFQNACG